MRKLVEAVKEFHKTYNVPVSTGRLKNGYVFLNRSEKRLRFDLMDEENREYLEANCSEEVADALGDQLYILIGTFIQHGLQDKIEDLFFEIHRSNMSKLGGGDGKVLKGPNYFKPDIAKVLSLSK